MVHNKNYHIPEMVYWSRYGKSGIPEFNYVKNESVSYDAVYVLDPSLSQKELTPAERKEIPENLRRKAVKCCLRFVHDVHQNPETVKATIKALQDLL